MMPESSTSKKIHECQTCGKSFARRTYLLLHEKIHGEKCYKCNACGRAFSQPSGLWTHKKSQNCLKLSSEADRESGRQFSCNVCSQRFSQKHLLTYHNRMHTGENPYSCTACGKMFRSLGNLKCHERTHSGQKPYVCIFCGNAFSQLGPLRMHCRKKHQSKDIYKCVVCNNTFEKFWDLSSHKKTHEEIFGERKSSESCRTEGGPVLNEVAQDGCQIVDNGKFLAEEEGNVLGNIKHSPSNKFPSSFENKCDAAVENTNDTRVKRSSGETTNTSIKNCLKPRSKDCFIANPSKNECSSEKARIPRNKIFLSSKEPVSSSYVFAMEDHPTSALQGEERNENESQLGGEEYPHVCPTCNKTFPTSTTLAVHQSTHSREKSYNCIFCPKSYTQRASLLLHCRRIHHSDEIYQCDICKERFVKFRDLSSHKLLHEGPCTMAQSVYNDSKFAAMYRDEETENRMDDTGPETVVNSLIPELNVSHHHELSESPCDFRKEQDKHSPFASNKNGENMDSAFTNTPILGVHVKQEEPEFEENYFDCSTDSGKIHDASQVKKTTEVDERDSLHQVSMLPICTLECREESEDHSSNIWDRQSRHTKCSQYSDECLHPENESDCFKSNVGGIHLSADEEGYYCTRVSTPENDPELSWCFDDYLRNSFIYKSSKEKIETKSSNLPHHADQENQNTTTSSAPGETSKYFCNSTGI